MTDLISLQSALVMVTGVLCGMAWSFLMAAKVAAPRAAQRFLDLLKGKTQVDREAIQGVREQLVRPELVEATAAINKQVGALDARISTELQGVSANLDAKFEAIQMPEAPDLEVFRAEIMDDFRAEISNFKVVIPQEAVDAMTASMKTHLEMAIKGMKAAEANAIRRYMNQAGIDFEAAGAETEELLLSQLTDQQVAMRRLITAKVPKQVREDHPEFAWAVKTAQQMGADYMQKRLQGGQGTVVEGGEAAAGYSPYRR